MKKSSFLIILILFSLISYAQQQVVWDPVKGKIYGDIMKISSFNHDSIQNFFIGYDEGEILPVPKYYLNGFDGVNATRFLWSENNQLYISKISYPKLFSQKDTNSITLAFTTSNGITHYETAEYYYSKPVLECLEVNGEPYSENMLLVNPEICSLSLIIRSSLYPLTSEDNGDDRISGVFQILNGTTYRAIPDTRYKDTTFNVNVSSLGYGLHELELFAFGKKANPLYPDEFSEKIKIRIVKFDFFISGSEDYSVCKCDSMYFLSGRPGAEGGIFSGECVVASSNVFNPTLSPNQSTSITYKFPVDGIYYPVTRTISFDPLPVITLDVQTLAGIPHEVCGYEHGAVYEISGTEINSSVWTFPESMIKKKYFENDNRVVIDWAESGDGSIYVSVTSDKGCESQLQHMVHIGINKAPKDSTYVSLYDKMLFSNADTSIVKVFYWYKINADLTEEFLNSTTRPYFVLNEKPLPGESFYVWTGEDSTSCRTHSYLYTVPENAKAMEDLGEKDHVLVKIYPNPSKGDVNIEFLQPLSIGTLTVINIYGQQISQYKYENIKIGDSVRIMTHDYQKGVYFLSFSEAETSKSYKLIVY